jgi:hypothetical protein
MSKNKKKHKRDEWTFEMTEETQKAVEKLHEICRQNAEITKKK